ncbi:Hpt domain-containing protein [Panacibacter ginsenosidivorans]|uniref:Hpt domain-containing protein n=1 Tax=Panacibacter ginsenosidivorans TaxID=1813871 RepID=A0A5B8V643_9BACT|nr:Hpt domain-containing protein [Panacibacter ginsenosidivorans]QEC66967.1 Hpt domain-containing protein [Panacibacter ginsenosidivorans]
MTPDAQLYNLGQLKEIDDNEDFILQVITIFLETVPSNAEALVKACAEKDWEQVYFFAHKIKANVTLLSMDMITEDVKFVEQSAKNRININMIADKVNFIDGIIKNAAGQMKKDFDFK